MINALLLLLFKTYSLMCDFYGVFPVLETELAMEECGRAIIEFFTNKLTKADVRAVLLQRPGPESFCVIQILMAHFSERLEGLILLVNVSYFFLFIFYPMIVLTSKVFDIVFI